LCVTMSKIFLVYGASGYFGTHVAKWLKAQNRSFVIGKARIDNLEDVKKEIDEVKPSYVICSAGLKGKPNVNWFENPENHSEAYKINVQAQVDIATECIKRGIHCTLFGTGFVYNYDEKHPIGDPVGFKEEDAPNWEKLHYVKLRIVLEEKLKDLNVLNLRITLPISEDFHPGSLLTKLITFPNITSMPCSFTIIDDLWPLISLMAEQNVTGTYNFNDRGVITHDEILKLYQKHVKPDHKWTLVENNGSRPAAFLCTEKLEKLFPGKIPHVKDSIEKIFISYKAQLEKQQQQKQ